MSEPEVLSTTCRNHPETAATWRCSNCHTGFCDLCVQGRGRPGFADRRICRLCGSECASLDGRSHKPAPLPFWLDAISYPFRGGGVATILADSAVFLILIVGCYFQPFPTVNLPMRLMSLLVTLVYLFAYAASVLAATAAEDDSPPENPGFIDLLPEIVQPAGRFFAAVGVSLLPVYAMKLLERHSDVHIPGAAYVCILAVGVFYLPMAMIGLAVLGTIEGLSPARVLRGVRGMGLFYAVLPLTLPLILSPIAIGLYLYLGSRDYYTTNAGAVEMILGWPVAMYCVMAGMRLLGLAYRHRAKRIGWIE